MVAQYLKALKSKGKFTSAELAQMSGIPETTIRKILSGETADPRFDTVAKLVLAMGGSLNDLVEKVEEKDMKESPVIAIKEVYEAQIKDLQDHIDSFKQDKKHLTIAVSVLGSVIAVLLVLAVAFELHGWVR